MTMVYGDGETKILVNTPEIKAMFTALKSWKDEGFFEWYGTGWNDNQKPFEEGKIGMWFGSSGSFGGLQKTATMPFSATFLPYWEGVTKEPTQTFIGGAALFAMSGKSDEENKATAEFFRFLTSPEVQVKWHKDTGYVPITKLPMSWPRQKATTKESLPLKSAFSSFPCQAATTPRATAWASTSRSAT
jgi:sn-glycerol 3-phosphate transport system substrate-binding protein